MKLFRNALLLLVLFLVVDIARYAVYPDISKLAGTNPEKTAFMEYREAEWRREGLTDKKIRQRWVPLKRVSPALVKAVLISEDDKFWKHDGFDYEAIESAVERNMKAGKFKFGGSTISQQLAKNLYLSPSKNPIRKIQEAILTWRIEHALSKRRILELYVNVAEWGDGIFGIEEAARLHFGTSAAGLSASQASKLAAALPNPIRYQPNGSSSFVRNRSKRIYAIMLKRGVVVPDFQEVMTLPAGPAPDSLTVGIPEYLIDQASAPDSSTAIHAERKKRDVQPAPDADAGAVK
ncbi:MAG: monofunctional biosynthetic peptidoglycan transglycosylase [Chlorobiaceae bacterium]|nr:monofunctional biosynthetic peptidoglycan transglycosylase [Chlorobiaceae bacterium]